MVHACVRACVHACVRTRKDWRKISHVIKQRRVRTARARARKNGFASRLAAHTSDIPGQQLSLMGRDAINRHTRGSAADRPDEIGRSEGARARKPRTGMAENRNRSCCYILPSLCSLRFASVRFGAPSRSRELRRWNPPGCVSSGT